MRKKICSVLGDSISTYLGYSPQGFEFYDSYIQREAGISSVEDTWWWKVIEHMGGELGCNHSISGSTVSCHNVLSGTSNLRQEALGENGTPDIILLFMGANDWGFSILPEEFEDSYKEMLYQLKRRYPLAEICCATLISGKDIEDPEYRFMNIDNCISQRVYSRIIRECVKNAGLKLIDLESYGLEYDTIDGIHPNKKGMALIADLWMRELDQ